MQAARWAFYQTANPSLLNIYREISQKTFLVSFPPWKKVEDLIELRGFSLPQDVVVKMTKWKGSCDPFGELVESDPTKIPFERLIETKKKLFLLGFTIEWFEHVGGVDYVIDIVSEDEDEDAGGAEEDLGNDKEEDSKDEMQDDLMDDETAIDEVDKYNIPRQRGGFSQLKLDCGEGTLNPMTAYEFGPGPPIVDGENTKVGVSTPLNLGPISLMDAGISDNKEYCGSLLKSVDMVDSEDEMDPNEDVILETLPYEAVQMLQFSRLKRSLLDSLDQPQEVPSKNLKWRPVMVSKYSTRRHDNVNIMEKVVAYKMKKNLEIPITYKGKSFPSNDPNILIDHVSKLDFVMGGDNSSRLDIIEDLIFREQESCLAFPNNHPEVVLPNNLDVVHENLVGIPFGASSSKMWALLFC
ncbi:hypothetical protein D1007_31587 [Hordeum vulgare]|nr:hypothetical protein D1007_31587 [Hordeum vulgare]